MIDDFLILISLLFVAGFFSAAEIAFISLSPAKVRALVEEKKAGALLVQKLKDHPHKLLITVLIGNNLANIATSVYTTIVFQQLLGDAALGIITGGLTLAILIFGEIVPKAFAQAHAKRLSRYFAPFLYFFYILFTPLVWLLDGIVKFFLHFSGDGKIEKHMTDEELKAFLTLGTEEGSIEPDEQELIENVLEFSDTRVEEIMVPRVDIDALPVETTIRDAVDFIIEHHHTRIPVYQGTIDHVVGMITVKDILYTMHREGLGKTLNEIKLLNPLQVPISQKINVLFNEFQRRHMHLAIVLDEHGGTAGLITLEDILEELVGEIADEFEPQEEPNFSKIGKSEVEANGKALIEDINEALDIEIPSPEHKTISYYITETLGRFPKRGEIIEQNGYRITVDEMVDKHTIKKVSVERTE